jgi:hypothetical protein
LRIKELEAQVVQRIIEGLNPTQHARFVFLGPVNIFNDLERLIVVDRNIAFAHQTRERADASSREASVQAKTVDVTSNSPRKGPIKAPTTGKRPVYSHRGKLIHIRRNCFARRNTRTRAVQENHRSLLARRNK